MFPKEFHKVNIYCLIRAYITSHGTVFCKARVTCAVSNREDSSLAICLRLSARRHSMLRRHRIVFTHREHIVIVSSSVSEVLNDTKGRVVSYANRIAIVSKQSYYQYDCLILTKSLSCTSQAKVLILNIH